MTGVDPEPASPSADPQGASLVQAASLSLFHSLGEAVALHEMMYDEGGRPIDYRILYINAAYEGLFDVSMARAVGARASEIHGSAPDLEVFAQVASSLSPTRFETVHGGLDKTLGVSAFSWSAGRFGAVFVDLSERTRLETELRAARRLEPFAQLARSVAHDFNNVLTAILGYTALLDGALARGDRRRMDVDEIRKSAQTAARLTAQLLACSATEPPPSVPIRGPRFVKPSS